MADDLVHGPIRVTEETQPPTPNPKTQWLPHTLQAALNMMGDHIEAPISITDIADHCDIHVKKLGRLFNRHFHQSPLAVYQSIRLKRAVNLLDNSQLSLNEIALVCGYETNTGFHKAFLRRYRMSPGRYRMRLNSGIQTF